MNIKDRLLQLGIKVEDADEGALAFAENKTREHIKNVCNLDYVPDALEYLATDMACGEFLRDRLLSGLVDSAAAESALKAITEGDVSLEYDTGSGKSAADRLLAILGRGEADLYRFRKMCW